MTKNPYRARSYYRGRVAQDYEAQRTGTRQWRREQRMVGRLLTGLRPVGSILDVPFGTGRFVRDYGEHGHRVYGLDISLDMLRASSGHGSEHPLLIVGDAARMPLHDASVDHVVCIRFVNWLSIDLFSSVLAEMKRVARHRVMIEVHQMREIGYIGAPFRLLVDLLTDPARVARGPRWMVHRTARWLSGRSSPSEVGEPKFSYHPEQAVLETFRHHGLEVKAVLPVVRKTDLRKRQARSILLYVLESTEHAQAAETAQSSPDCRDRENEQL